MFFFKKNALYNLYTLYNFWGLRHIPLGFYFFRVCIVKVVIRLMAKYHLILKVMPCDSMFRNLVHIYQSLRFIL